MKGLRPFCCSPQALTRKFIDRSRPGSQEIGWTYKLQKNFRNFSPAPRLSNLEGKLVQAITIEDLGKNGVSGIPFFCF
jgi:hypothetical protein